MKKQPTITEQLRKAISEAERRGVTQYQIAKAANMPRSMVQRIASGETIPRLDTAERLARAVEKRLVLIVAN